MTLKKICRKCKKEVVAINESVCKNCKTKSNRTYDKLKRDKKSYSFYHSKEWLNLRAYLLKSYGDMDLWHYAKTKEYKKANTLHHIIELSEDWTKRLDKMNLFPVSSESHNEIHRLYKTDKEKTQGTLKRILKEHIALINT